MDVDKQHFNVHLLPILRHIANAEFVAFDLEMSGIATSTKQENKPNLQEVYEDVKAAAEKYQVLQVGITCIEKDEELDLYMARPYNFNLSPLFIDREKLGIERTFAFSSGAIQFLLGDKVQFDIAAPFYTGVPYLSRDEEREAIAKFENVVYTDLTINPNDTAALEFYRDCRQTINTWLAIPEDKSKNTCVNIVLSGNRFGIRLVHQLVKSEFPDLVVRWVRDGDYMQVTVRDEAKEASMAKSKLKSFEKTLSKQIGLRFVFEALFGGDLSKIDPQWFNLDNEGIYKWKNPGEIMAQIEDIVAALKVRRPALVGHNMNTDLAFMYSTFIGNLPDTYQEFASIIHELCPIIIDTKYIATHNCGSMDTQSDLPGLLKSSDQQAYPLVVLAEAHASYGHNHKGHEAGYDSWMTAQVLLKSAYKLYVTQPPSQPTNSSATQNTKENTRLPYRHKTNLSSSSTCSSQSTNGGVSLLDTDLEEFNESIMGKTYDDMDKEAHSSAQVTNMEAHSSVQIINKEAQGSAQIIHHEAHSYAQIVPPPKPFKKLRGPGEAPEKGMSWASTQMNGGYSKRESKPDAPDQWIPTWDSSFWRDYLNRLRVFQAEESFYVLKDYGGDEL